MYSSFWFVLTCCLIIHLQFLVALNWTISFLNYYILVPYNLLQGTAYLLYPVSGWIAEVHFSNFKMIKWSFVIVMISLMAGVLYSAVSVFIAQQVALNSFNIAFAVVYLLMSTVGLGMFESNAIQFGMDQMLEASSEQLSSFIHWYFLCAHVGSLALFYIVVGMSFCFYDCKIEFVKFETIYRWVLLIYSILLSIVCLSVVLYIYCSKKDLYNAQSSRNSLNIICGILKYSWKHKAPVWRSAFTYWENDTPSRIDLGKDKYGGPYTYEEVEDVKSFFRLLLLILSLFGFHLSGDGYSLTYSIMNKSGCPSVIPFFVLISNPQHIPLVIVILGVPIFQYIKRHFARFIPNMLTRLWIGLFISLVNETTQVLLNFFMKDQEFKCPEIHSNGDVITLSKRCFHSIFNFITNNTCDHFCSDPPVNDATIYLSFLPLFLSGISYLLVFMTALEFICAQSPNALKGLLIGIWYSMFSVKYMIINILDTHPMFLEITPWNIYHGIKGFGIFLSIFAFSVVCKNYRYRERNEIVNEQSMIEEQYERELLLNNRFEDSKSSYIE